MTMFSETPLRAITVCVDYADYLSLALPYNRHHFTNWMIVTAPGDERTRDTVIDQMVENSSHTRFEWYETNAFYQNGAKFNKWAALEEALDLFGRHGWIVILDADTVWPTYIPDFELVPGNLYTPFRRMKREARIPSEGSWSEYPRHRNENEFAGYSQIFHAEDPVLGPAPWHQVDWAHAGGADSFFQAKWSKQNKIRPPFEVLHLGEPGTNWCGRVTANSQTGETPEAAKERLRTLRGFMRGRKRAGDYAHEKIQQHGVLPESAWPAEPGEKPPG